MRDLIKRCWSENPEERPSFDNIYKELISDFSIFGESVYEEEIKDYIEMLDEFHDKSPENHFALK